MRSVTSATEGHTATGTYEIEIDGMVLCSWIITITGTATATAYFWIGSQTHGGWFPLITDATTNTSGATTYAASRAKLVVTAYTSGEVSLHVHGIRGG